MNNKKKARFSAAAASVAFFHIMCTSYYTMCLRINMTCAGTLFYYP